MAYSDYGAYVTRNGEHRPDREDCGVWNPSITKAYNEYGVLGDGPVHVALDRPYHVPTVWDGDRPVNWARLAGIGYDTNPDALTRNRFHMDEDGVLHEHGGESEWWQGVTIAFDVRGRHVELGVGPHHSRRYGHTAWARLVEPDGTVWEGECGSAFGGGYTNLPRFEQRHVPTLPEGRWRRPVPCPECHVKPSARRIPFGMSDYAQAEVRCPRCGLHVITDPEWEPARRHLLLRECVAWWNTLCSAGRIPETGQYQCDRR